MIAAQLEEIYKLGDARTPAQQVKLAKDFLELAEKTVKPEERFVMFRKAAELADKAGDAALMFQAVDRMAAQFELDGLAVKQKLLARPTIGANVADGLASLVEGANTLIDQALAEERFEVAIDLAGSALRTCQRPPARRSASRWSNASTKSDTQEAGGADRPGVGEGAGESPGPGRQPDAGQAYCFSKGDWATGLPYLAKGSDAEAKALALQETRSPPKEPGRADQVGRRLVGLRPRGQGPGPHGDLGPCRDVLPTGGGKPAGGPGEGAGGKAAGEDHRLWGKIVPTQRGNQPPPAIAPFDEKKAKDASESLGQAPWRARGPERTPSG